MRVTLLNLRGEDTDKLAVQANRAMGPLTQTSIRDMYEQGLSPTLMMYQCVQCQSQFAAVVYRGANGEDVAVLPEVSGGLATKNTPTAVRYYLDQAARCHSVSARSACIAMFRAALEHVLEEQGFDARMCGLKLAQLEKAISAGTAPSWATRIDPDIMSMLKDLGNGVLHTNGGDITLQENATPDVIIALTVSMTHLIDEVYERPLREKERKSLLAGVVEKFSKK